MQPEKNKIKVAIITPVYNRKALTLLCLKSISRLLSDNLEILTIIVDDGSSDGTSEAINEQFPEVEIVKGDGNLWFTEGTNVGIRAALKHNPKYLLLINDDQVFDDKALQVMVECAEKFPKSIVGSLLLLWDTPHILFQVSPIWDTWSGGWRHWRHQTVWTVPEEPWEVGIIVGNCLLVPTKAVEECGLMDSRRFPNFGDAEFTPRMRKKGWQLLIEPRARVFIQPNAPTPQIKKMTLRQKFNALFFDLKHIQNFRRRFYANLAGADSTIEGILSFFIFIVRIFLKINAESNWSETQSEKNLSETFAKKIVKVKS